MKYKVLEGGFAPTRAHFDDAGIDLRTPETFMLAAAGEPGDSAVIDTKVAFQIPIGYFGKIEAKSGLNVNHNIRSTGGVIDSGFRGTIRVRITNYGHDPYIFKKGDKITQMVLIPCGLFDLEKVDELDPSESGRDENGWGSTGK